VYRVGIDTGGTFTDFVAISEEGAVVVAKHPSTPRPPVDAFMGVIGKSEELPGRRWAYIISGIASRDRSDDAELLLLLGPAMRQRAGERSDREIGRGGAVGDGFDNARRHEGEWNEPPDVALDLVLTSGNRLE
jgi:N-methylhydantoinase A